MNQVSNSRLTSAPDGQKEIGQLESLVVQLETSGKDPRLAFGKVPEDGLAGLTADGFGLYSFCTENIEGYLPHLSVEGKRCLTVAASGDQVIALLTAGAAEVVTFDVVPTAGDITELKMRALAHLDWDGSEHFARQLWDRALSPREFARLCDYAPEGRFNWYRSVVKQAVNGLPVGNARDILKRYQIYGYPGYLASEEVFAKAKSAVSAALSAGRVSFVKADVRDLPYLGLDEFDVIVLSNILAATFEVQGNRHLFGGKKGVIRYPDLSKENGQYAQALVSSMIWPVAGMLTANGRMMASYHYGCEPIAHLKGECRYCGDHLTICECDRTDPFAETLSRRRLFSPPPGFLVEEHGWQTVNRELSGEDVAVFVRRVSC